MLRSAFRSKTSKESKDEVGLSPEHNVQQFDYNDFMDSSKEQEIGDIKFNFMDNYTDKPRGDPNANLLAKSRVNPSLDYQLDDNEDDHFPYTERQIYEMQLVQLQEQLVATMIQEQENAEKLKAYEELSIEKLQKDLKAEQNKNAELTEKMKVLKNKVHNQKITRSNASRSDPRKKSERNSKHYDGTDNTEHWVEVSRDITDVYGKDKTDTSEKGFASNSQQSENKSMKQSSTESAAILTSTHSFGEQPTVTSDVLPHKPSRIQSYKKKVIEMVVDRIWDFVNEEQEPSSTNTVDDNGDPLAVKTLKENINRFTHAIKPITHFVKSVTEIVRWSNPASSLISFIVYMYAARHGYLFSLVLLLMIWQLFMNYLYSRGFALQFGQPDKEEPTTDDKSWSDKFQLVLQVARKVQNILGKMADSIEKVKNLLMWQHPATKTLFLYMCVAFIASIIISGTTLFMFMALGFGIKVFITGPIYSRFPKVKERYDGVARLWKELPTDADLEAKKIDCGSHQLTPSSGHSSSDGPVAHTPTPQVSTVQSSQHWTNLCEKFRIPLSEFPLPTWEEGRRCTLMDKDKPLTNMKNGRLFLTQSYLCFERNKAGSSKNFAIKLENITHVSKCKPIGIIPGSGMAIEVEVKGSDKPYIFGALLGRDELFENIILTGRAADLEWAG